MALQNIGAGNKDDAFYRYKMPRMITKIEGRGNGIKTNVVNMVEIAKALARRPAYTTKYFGCELGAQSKYDEKTGISLVNGSHETAKLAGLLENFIKKYVQCYGCGNPETEVLITKTQMIALKCAACGFLSDVDMRDKLTSFIIKNPPEQKKGSQDKKAMRRAEKERLKEGEMADEEQKKFKKEVKKKSVSTTSKVTLIRKNGNGYVEDHSDENEGGEEDDGVQWQTDTSAEAARYRIQEQLSAVSAGMVMLSTTEETSSELDVKSEQSENGSNILSEIKVFLKKGTADEFKSFLATLPSLSQDVMNSLVVALFGDVRKGFAREMTMKKCYLKIVVRDGGESQLRLLRAIEVFCVKFSEGLKEVALILKSLYDGDVLEEELIMEWYQQGLKGADKGLHIWKNAKPFIDWLQSAESESEEE